MMKKPVSNVNNCQSDIEASLNKCVQNTSNRNALMFKKFKKLVFDLMPKTTFLALSHKYHNQIPLHSHQLAMSLATSH